MMRAWQIIRRTLEWIGIAVGALVLLALVLFGVAYVINSHDEALTTQAQALLLQPPNPYSAEENIYLTLVGFDAPSGQSPTAVGRSRIEHFNQNLDRALRGPPLEMPDILNPEDPRRLEFKGDFDFTRPFDSYWSGVPPHRQTVERLLTDNRELYERYRALLRQRGYFATARPSPLAPMSFVPGRVRTLFLADVVLRMRSDDPQRQREGLADLESDVQLWRAVLTGEGPLISHALANAYLHWDELVLADMIADPHAPIPTGAADADAVAPLFALADWDLSGAYREEFRFRDAVLRQARFASEAPRPLPEQGTIDRWLDRIGNHFLKLNATENLLAAQAWQLMRAAAPGAARGLPVVPPWTLRMVYNPIGNVLAWLGVRGQADYRARAWDGAAYQRLVRLSYEIRRQRIGPAGIPAFMRAHPEWSTHPDDGRPFLWDEKEETLRVQNLSGPRPGTSFLVHVWMEPSGG
jgi:hypothetical protein